METKHIETRGREIIERCGDIPVYAAELSVLEQLTGFKLTRGMLCAMRRPQPLDVREILSKARRVAGECDESHQSGCHFPLCGGAGYGCGAPQC